MPYMEHADLDLLASAAKFAEAYAASEATEPARLIGWLERFVETVPIVRGMPIIEHAFGVLPTLRQFDGRTHNVAALEALRRGKMLASLGLFTPTPEFSWAAAAVRATKRGDQSILNGEARVGAVPTDWTVVLTDDIEQPELYRLALIANNQEGVRRTHGRGSAAAAEHGEWLILEGVVVEPSFLSVPVSLSSGTQHWETLDAYASVFALAATLYAGQAIDSARAALRVARHAGKQFNTSQVLAMGTTELEIQTQFAESAARTRLQSDRPCVPGLLLAAAASRLLIEASCRVRTVVELVGAESNPAWDTASDSLCRALFGGVQLLESEAARTMGI